MTDVVTNDTRFASQRAHDRERARLEARQGCHPFSLSHDPLRPWLVKLLDDDASVFISDYDYCTFANYIVPHDDWQLILTAALMVRSSCFRETRRSHVFWYAPGKEWRIITVEAFDDGSTWIVDDDTLTPAVA